MRRPRRSMFLTVTVATSERSERTTRFSRRTERDHRSPPHEPLQFGMSLRVKSAPTGGRGTLTARRRRPERTAARRPTGLGADRPWTRPGRKTPLRAPGPSWGCLNPTSVNDFYSAATQVIPVLMLAIAGKICGVVCHRGLGASFHWSLSWPLSLKRSRWEVCPSTRRSTRKQTCRSPNDLGRSTWPPRCHCRDASLAS